MTGIKRKLLRDLDWGVLVAPIALTLFGCMGIYSASPGTDLWKKQLLFLFFGIVITLLLAVTDYRRIILDVAPFAYGATLLLLLLVLTPLGVEVNGNRAWLKLASIRFQPSEFAKLATILMMARYVSHIPGSIRIKDILVLAAITFPPVILIHLENDTGTMLTFGAILASFLFLGGMRKRLILAGVFVCVLGLVVVYPHLKEYQKQRIKAVWEPEKVDPHGYGYQTIQSVVAVGSGGVLGKGFTHGTQGQLGFLPYAYTDFIAAVIAEETGLAGILFILSLYLLLLWRLIAIAQGSRDRAGSLMVMGSVSLLSFHIVCNLGMVVALMPTMGIPLPLLSQGGTSLLAVFAGIGLALSVRLRRFVN